MMKRIFIVLLCGMLFACSSKINRDNYANIKTDMQMQEVVKLLGPPQKEQRLNVGALKAANVIWEEKGKVISVQFYNDKVVSKHFSSDGVNTLEAE